MGVWAAQYGELGCEGGKGQQVEECNGRDNGIGTGRERDADIYALYL